jgi:hypothetical protein
MHALQLIPLVALVLEISAGRIPSLRHVDTRSSLITVVTTTYVAILGVLTWQALRGQSIVHPDTATWLAFATIASGVAAATVILLRGNHATAESSSPHRSPIAAASERAAR